MKNTRKGFTLVELLAVIVILAIIMIIAIPAVLSTMQTAKQKSFVEYVTKVYTQAQNKYMEEKASGTFNKTSIEASKTKTVAGGGSVTTKYACYNYDITKDIGLTSTGNYQGYVVICETASASNAGIQILVQLADGEFYTRKSSADAVGLWNYTTGAPKSEDIRVGNEKTAANTAPDKAKIEAELN